MNGVLFSAIYGFPPNSYDYCGSSSFPIALRNCLSGNNDFAALEKELKKFKAQHKYLSLIGQENNLQCFHPKVVEAFWVGNELLENVQHGKLRNFLRNSLFPKNSSRGKRLAENLPEGLLPHHSFNPLYVNFVTSKVARSVDNFDACCITAGKVKSISDNSAIVDRFSIEFDNGFHIGKKTVEVDLARKGIRLARNLEKGDLVSVHWGMAVEKISAKEFSSLKKYTRITVDILTQENDSD
jgi:hydrogenase maturation factor